MRGGSEPDKIEEENPSKAAVKLLALVLFWGPHSRAAPPAKLGLTERHAHERRVLKWIKARREK